MVVHDELAGTAIGCAADLTELESENWTSSWGVRSRRALPSPLSPKLFRSIMPLRRFGRHAAFLAGRAATGRRLLRGLQRPLRLHQQQSVLFGSQITSSGGQARVLIYNGEKHGFFNVEREMALPTLYEMKEHLRMAFGL